MDQLYVFLIKNDVWIYFLCGLGAIWYGYEFLRGSGSLQRAHFSLERERALRRRNGSFLFLLFFVSVAALVTFVNVRIQPNLPDELLNPPTPTPRAFVTPFVENAQPTPTRHALPTPTSILAPTATLRIPLTPTPPSRPSGGVATLEVQALREGCAPGVDLTQPPSGSTVSGGMSLFGSADSTSFRSYVLEINGPETGGEWTPLTPVAVTQAVPNGFLGSANLEEWATGVYQIRLTVLAGNNVQTGQCIIQIGLNNDS
jgi:hypothetical protein